MLFWGYLYCCKLVVKRNRSRQYKYRVGQLPNSEIGVLWCTILCKISKLEKRQYGPDWHGMVYQMHCVM